MPNRRAGLFLKDHLAKLIDKPTWLPRIIGTEELIEQLSDAQLIDNTTQLFELYEVYRNLEIEPEGFDEFSKWGQILLHDFNEIDRYLVPTAQLFKHINEARAIEVWNVDGQELTELQRKYLQFWEQLGQIYHAYNRHLTSKRMAYQGMAYRIVAESLKADPEQFVREKIEADQLLFVGFNALNKAEEVLIDELLKQQKGEVLFDADAYFFNEEQESGMFLRKFKRKWGEAAFRYAGEQLRTETKHIEVLGIPQQVGQAKYLTHLLKDTGPEAATETAIVLANENLLVPVLQSIPDNLETVNVTMGYSLRNTALNNFFQIYLNTLVNAERFGHKQQLTYHHKDLVKLFQLPFSKVVFGEEVCAAVLKQIIQHNWVFINKEKLSWINERLMLPLEEHFNVRDILRLGLKYIETAKKVYLTDQERKNTLELEYLFQFSRLFKQLSALVERYPFIDTAKGFYNLFYQLMSSYSIELYGEPLRGVQVLGMLETRNIDFKSVILLSTNEGVLPAGKTYNSFIPFDIKKAYGLPTHVEKDAIYAYHFYRLIQNAENIRILYNTETNEFGSGEQSRFVTQIEHELEDYNPNIAIRKKLLTYPTKETRPVDYSMAKTAVIVEQLKERFKEGFSPSALTTYLTCPLDFYYKYVIGVGDPDEVEESIQMNTFGDFVHKSLELLYQNRLNQVLTSDDLKTMLAEAPEVVIRVFSEKYTNRELRSGKNLLSLNVAQNYVKTFLNNELTLIESGHELVVIALEKELHGSLQLGNREHKLFGKADRIDRLDGKLRIIDYKTGLVEPTELRMTHLEQVRNQVKAFQVMMYAYLYRQMHGMDEGLSAGIVSFRKLSEGFMPVVLNKQAFDDELLNQFELVLQEVLTEITDVNLPFVHQEDARYCQFCE
ncbi:MAG: PD-(D/E)XK nuclease family protein [Flavobacteriales bacterium]|nr:PD-(D/E)XK nuclease family protein [Flavobacteriales bacterium]